MDNTNNNTVCIKAAKTQHTFVFCTNFLQQLEEYQQQKGWKRCVCPPPETAHCICGIKRRGRYYGSKKVERWRFEAAVKRQVIQLNLDDFRRKLISSKQVTPQATQPVPVAEERSETASFSSPN